MNKKLSRGIDYEAQEAKGFLEIWNTQAGHFFGGISIAFLVLITIAG